MLRKLAKNTTFSVMARVTDIGVGIFSFAVIARYLGVNEFGYFAFITATSLLIVPLSDFGFERILTREIASDRSKAGKYLGISFLSRLFISAIIILCVLLILGFFEWDKRVEQAFLISVITQLIISMGILGVSTFRAFEKMEYEFLLNFNFNITYLALLAIVIMADMGLVSIFGAKLIASGFNALVTATVILRGHLKPELNFDSKLLKYLLKEGFPLVIFAFLWTTSSSINAIMLKYLATPDDIAIFESANRVIMQLQIFPTAIAISLFPYFSRLAVESMEGLRAAFYRSFKFLLIIGLPLTVTIIFTSDTIISLIYGNSFSRAATSLNILACNITFLFLVSLQSFVFTSMGRQTINTIGAAVSLIINILAGFVLIPRFGYIGASVASLFSYAVFFVMMTFSAVRVIGSPPAGLITFKPFFSILAMGIAGIALHTKGGLVEALTRTPAIIFIYVMMLIILKTFASDEVEAVKTILIRKRGPRRG